MCMAVEIGPGQKAVFSPVVNNPHNGNIVYYKCYCIFLTAIFTVSIVSLPDSSRE